MTAQVRLNLRCASSKIVCFILFYFFGQKEEVHVLSVAKSTLYTVWLSFVQIVHMTG
jgi:hypothetical protein